MKFCSKCGSLMVLRNQDNHSKIWVCLSCGFSEKLDESTSIVISREIEHSERERIIVVSNKDEVETLPVTKAICPRCGWGEAYYWLVQTRRADEPPTRFFRCTKCKHVWREYD